MQVLPIEFKQQGYTYRQIVRTEHAAVYEQSAGGKVHAYEVICILRRPEREAFGKVFPAGEYYPSSEQWGPCGRTYVKLEDAMDTFNGMVPVEEEVAA